MRALLYNLQDGAPCLAELDADGRIAKRKPVDLTTAAYYRMEGVPLPEFDAPELATRRTPDQAGYGVLIP